MGTKYIVNNLSGQTINGQPIDPKYKVYTALLTQSGGSGESDKNPGDDIFKGVTYYINDNPDNSDFTVYGAPNNNAGTYFFCTQDGIVPNGAQLLYNTGAPVATVLENTIGNIWWAYSELGIYNCITNDLFTDNKTAVDIDNIGKNGIFEHLITYSNIATTGFFIYTANTLILSDDILNATRLEIKVYN